MSDSGSSDDSGNAVAGMLRAGAQGRWLDRVAYRQPGSEITHRDLHRLAARLADCLRDHGIGPGSRVVLQAPDGIAWVACFLALARLAAVGILINPALAPAEIRIVARDADPLLWIVGELGALPPVSVPVHTLAGLLNDARGRKESPIEPVHGTEPLYVQYTSGTTGTIKGAIHRHADLAHYWRSVREVLLLEPEALGLSVSKLYFAYGFGNSLVYPLLSGSAAIVLPHRPDPAEVLEIVEAERVTALWAVPSAYAALVTRARTVRSASPNVQLAVSAGELLPAGVSAGAAEWLGIPLTNGLGSTEIGGFCALQPGSRRGGADVGQALAGFSLEVRGETDAKLGAGVVGRLYVRGPTIMSGYLARSEASAQSLQRGWLVSNDRASMTDVGTVSLFGRTDDVEMVGGVGVWPQEIEGRIARHPAVAEAAVTAVPDADGATKLRAFLVRAPNLDTAAESQVEDELRRDLRATLAPYKVPRSFAWVDALPRTSTGKLQRFALRGTPHANS